MGGLRITPAVLTVVLEVSATVVVCPTSFPGLSYEDEARHEKALVWAGHVTTKNGSI